MASLEPLEPIYDSHKSFYGKAQILRHADGHTDLFSYLFHVATITAHHELIIYKLYSRTTTRHIREFARQDGFEVDSPKQLAKYVQPKSA